MIDFSKGGSYITVDFAETMVKERPMIEWVLFELRNKEASLWWRIRFMLNSFTKGFLSMVFGRFPTTSKWAAKTAYMSFRGIKEERIHQLVNHKRDEKQVLQRYILNLNPEFVNALSSIKQKHCSPPFYKGGSGGIFPNSEPQAISIHSQGTGKRAIELFIQRQDVAAVLREAGFYVSSIVASQMELTDGEFTGRLIGHVITKHSKFEGIPKGSIFVGDKNDEKAIRKLKGRTFEFINYKRL